MGGSVTGLGSILEKAKADAEALAAEQLTIEVDELGIELTCVVPSNGLFVESLAAKAKKSGTRMARALVGAQTRLISIHGVQIDDEETGEPLRFSDPALWKALGVQSTVEAVTALLGSDIVIARVAKRIIDDVDEDADPI